LTALIIDAAGGAFGTIYLVVGSLFVSAICLGFATEIGKQSLRKVRYINLVSILMTVILIMLLMFTYSFIYG
jgi:hypothetical protein